MPTATSPTPTPTLPVDDIVAEICRVHGEQVRQRAAEGVRRVAQRWQADDGDAAAMKAFCLEHFVAEPDARRTLLDRFETVVTTIRGHLYEINRTLRRWSDVAGDEIGADGMIATFDPAPDLAEQFYRQRIGFVALLNFERPALAELIAQGGDWSSETWAEVRISRAFGPRVPAALIRAAHEVGHATQMWVSKLHVPVGTLVDARGRRWFEADRKLLAHWLVREEIKAGYGDPEGIYKQRALMWVMHRQITGTIPTVVMEAKSTEDWDPQTNTVGGRQPAALMGPQRYEQWAAQRDLARRFDEWYPEQPTAIARKFDLAREVPEAEVERLLVDLLSSPVRRELAGLLRRRIGRTLEPQDIYYDDIADPRPADELNRCVRASFADEKSFQAKLPEVLTGLGFNATDAQFLASQIRVEIARGSGHAMRPGLPEFGSWLRTSRLADELGWDGFDTAMHELGHNLEQIISTHWVPRPALRGVPNTACTEAFAFLYQSLGRRVLGLETEAERGRSFATDSIQTMLAACQIAGPSLVELYAWRWLYQNPGATPQQLRDRVTGIADELWARFYAEDFGADPYHILAAYQHMISSPLYLADYTLGHIISHQIRSAMRGRDLAAETRRICSIGRVTPDLWMRRAVGGPISVEALTADAAVALAAG